MEYLQCPHKRRVLRSDRRPEMKRGECGETCTPHSACLSAPPSKRIVELLFSFFFFPSFLTSQASHSEISVGHPCPRHLVPVVDCECKVSSVLDLKAYGSAL